jgi:hypothetical protein
VQPFVNPTCFALFFIAFLSAASAARAADASLTDQQAPKAAEQPKNSYSVPAAGSFNLDLNYPGAAVRYFPADGNALELFGQGQNKIFAGGLRYYYYPAGLAHGALLPFMAAEADFTSFKGRYSKGTGIGGGLFGGVEYFLGRRISVQTDIGALYLSIQDKNTSLGESGLEFIMNLGFNFYFGGVKQ